MKYNPHANSKANTSVNITCLQISLKLFYLIFVVEDGDFSISPRYVLVLHTSYNIIIRFSWGYILTSFSVHYPDVKIAVDDEIWPEKRISWKILNAFQDN